VPDEAGRAAVDPGVIMEWLARLETEIHAIPRGFVLNLDEAATGGEGHCPCVL
jgi:hypothetical protein